MTDVSLPSLFAWRVNAWSVVLRVRAGGDGAHGTTSRDSGATPCIPGPVAPIGCPRAKLAGGTHAHCMPNLNPWAQPVMHRRAGDRAFQILEHS